MDDLSAWHLCEDFSVEDAAFLIAGVSPALPKDLQSFWGDLPQAPEGYLAARTALINAVQSGKLKAIIRYPARVLMEDYPYRGETEYLSDDDYGTKYAIKKEPDWKQTTIDVGDIKTWLSARGIKTGFFFEEPLSETADCLNKSHPNYAPKLAAAISAWQAVTVTPKLLDGKTPKQALEKWLKNNAADYSLCDAKGSPNKEGIEQIAKVANWKPEGGAAKTKGSP